MDTGDDLEYEDVHMLVVEMGADKVTRRRAKSKARNEGGAAG